jgi:hypothetical protein
MSSIKRFYIDIRPHGVIGGRTPRAGLQEVVDCVPERAAVVRAWCVFRGR